jgi:hypothetical protein
MMGLMTKMVLMKELLIKSGRTRKKERMKVHIHQNPWLLNKVNA